MNLASKLSQLDKRKNYNHVREHQLNYLNMPTSNETQKNLRLAKRLGDILTKLCDGEVVTISGLAKHFDTSERTIYRDLNDRFAFLPLHKTEEGYKLEDRYLGRLDYDDLRDFAAISGVVGMFPTLDTRFIRELLDTRVSMVYAVKGMALENSKEYQQLFDLLRKAILEKYAVRFTYKNGSKEVHPYKLIHHNGTWYLAAVQNEEIRTYRISRIVSAVINYDAPFDTNRPLMKKIEDEDSIWIGQDKQQVIVQLDATAAPYFRARQLLPEQETVRELEDGGILLSCSMVDPLQLLPIVRYWIPHSKIVHPTFLQEQLESQLQNYLVGQTS